ncbi:endonuclease/exonuclease/phosphatase family protein [Lacinutrix jangbogonensis]|uniref:endonuclease/exonuclease/phosphatase family protein n=1 Tax=Lacinutrix jangbogonensis TaxID=1469557 RepID=UPI00053E93D3|nr:endonuclease/exonuclease/phosphatase family protein [Lacinutrix jangbogonensis]
MITFLNKYKAYTLGVYAFFILLHFVLKDHLFPLSILFYATPLVLTIGFGCTILWLYKKNRIALFLIIILQSCLVYYWLNHQYSIAITKTTSVESKSILFWNIAKNENGFPEDIILDKTTSEDIAILTFVEADNVSYKDFLNLKNLYNQYTFKKLKGNMLIGVKGSIESIMYKTEENKFKFNHIISEIDNKKTSILIVDVYANPFYSKEDALKSIITYANINKIDIIVGDFNTPYESIHFKNLHKTFTSFHSYGDSFTATWPFGIPLLELDQIWVDESVYPLNLKKYNFLFSDHQLLIANYLLK